MNNMSNDKKPAIRFKDYSDDWEQRKFEIAYHLLHMVLQIQWKIQRVGPWKLTAKDIGDGYIDYSTAMISFILLHRNFL